MIWFPKDGPATESKVARMTKLLKVDDQPERPKVDRLERFKQRLARDAEG